MRKNIISAFFSGLAIVMAGCSSDITGDPESPKGSGDSILRLEIDKEEMTRSGIESTSFDEGDEVFVIVTDRTNPDILAVTTKATYTGGKWQLADEIDLASGNSGVVWTIADIQVYYPYDLASEGYDKESGKINVSFMQTDILYGASYGWSKGNSNATVSCKHAMTRLTLALSNESDSNVTVGRVKITNEGYQGFLGGMGTIDDKGISVTGYANSITVLKSGYKIPSGTTGYYDILLPPTSTAYGNMLYLVENEGISKTVLKFEAEVDEHTVNFDIDANAWEEGHQYTYPVTLAKEKVQREPNKIDMGYTEFIDGKEYKIYWSDINVGAYSEEDSGLLFGWGNPSPLVTSETLDLYPSANPPASIVGTQYDIAREHWGGNWRMPTNNIMWGLVANCNEEWVAFDDGLMGVRYTSKENGNTIFFPFTETRIGDAITVESECNYWLGELNEEDPTLAGTFYIYWANDHLSDYPIAGKPRYYGLPVRGIWIEEL